MVDPILIAAAPRSGTSMTAGLLSVHGVTVGEHLARTQYNPKGHFENSAMKRYLQQLMVRANAPLNAVNGPLPDIPVPDDFAKRLRACVNADGPWLLKDSKLLWFYRALSETFPSALWVLPLRPKQDVVRSMARHPIISKRIRAEADRGEMRGNPLEECAARWYDECLNRQKRIAANEWHVWVDVDAMARGDMREAQKLVEAAELSFDKRAAENFIERDYWHA